MTQVLDSIPWVRCASGNVSFVIANIKKDWFGSLNIVSEISLRDIQALALCNEAGEGGDGNGGGGEGRQGDKDEQ